MVLFKIITLNSTFLTLNYNLRTFDTMTKRRFNPISVAIVGQGNVGFHLYYELSKTEDIKVEQFNSRYKNSLKDFDVAIIAVSDYAIAEVSKHIESPLVVHTSGSSHIDVLQNKNRKGVFYPLQTFTKGKTVDFSKIPICAEARTEEDEKMLGSLASRLRSGFYNIGSEERKYIHVAAVFVNNFANHMFKTAWDILEEHHIPNSILQPLIKETIDKIERLTPEEAQTGPAIRNDEKTIKNHLTLLNDSQKKLYQAITESIQKNGEKL